MSRYSFAAFLMTGISVLGVSHASAQSNDTTEVTVVAKRLERTARSEQKAALNIVNIQSAETIEKYPDFNAAEALGRIPGVSMSEDTGEGRFVEIRGIDGNLNGATFGGIVLLNTNPGGTYFGGGGRAVEMDTVPIGSVDRLEVIKSLRPDMDAEGLGGVIELTPRSAATIKKPFIDATLAGGYEALRGDYKPFRAEIAAGVRSGALSAVFTASQFNNNQAIDDVEADYIDNSGKTYDDLQLRHYDYHRRRFGYGTEIDYQPSADHTYYLRANVAGYVESVLKRHEVINGLGDTTTQSGKVITATGASLQLKTTDEQETHRNTILAAGGADRFGDVKLDYQLSYSRSTFWQGYNYGATFNNDTPYTIAYDNGGNGNHPTFSVISGGSINDASQYYLKKLGNSQELDTDAETGAQLNLAFPAHWIGDDELKFGLRERDRHKTADSGSVSDKTAKQPLNQFSPATTYAGFYEGAYTTGPFPNLPALRALAKSEQTGNIGLDNVFDDNENVHAAYGQYTTTVGAWGFLGGLRVEQTQGTYRYNLTVNGVDGRAERKNSYTSYFPSAQLRYQFSDSLIARATYSTGIGRPGFNQLSSDSVVNTNAMTVETGNPDLKPTTGNNFDATLEWYLPANGIVQLGVFDKHFDNYIVTRERKGSYNGDAGYTFVSYYNISGPWARGLEAAYNQKFLGLPGLWSGLGVDANLTLVDSQAQLRDGDKRTLPGTSRVTGNVAVFYEKNGLNLRLATEYVGKTLFGVGDKPLTDLYQSARHTADFYAGYDIDAHWNLYFKAKNLTNEKLRFYIGSEDRPVQREFYDQSYELGLKAKF